MGRLVQSNQAVRSQADFFGVDHFTRVTGLTTSQVSSTLFFNNVLQPWILTDGTILSDTQLSSGNVYWNEIPGSPGFYSVRFVPFAVGYWRVVLTYPTGSQTVSNDFDVVAVPPPVDDGLKTSFIRPGC